MNVNPGTLNKRIQIIQKKESQDEDGFAKVEDSVVRSCWARYSNTSGSEIIKAGTEFASAKARFLVRYSKIPINEDMFVRYKGKEYNIEYINSYGDSGEYTEIWTSLKEMKG